MVASIRERIQTKAAALSSQNYFEMLGLSLGATPEDVRKAFFRLAKEFHPDRSAKDGLQDLEETLEYIFSNLSEAQRALIDTDARAEYEAAMREGSQRTSMAPGPTSARGDSVSPLANRCTGGALPLSTA